MAISTDRILSEDLLARCEKRAPVYDRENRFFQEDFDELREAGYLCMNVPTELGGLGKSLVEVCEEQRRLAYHAAPTALAVNMHLYWTGVAADLWRVGAHRRGPRARFHASGGTTARARSVTPLL